jgi:hypothetical protein
MLISEDNHVWPEWAPGWLQAQVESPDCTAGTHPTLRSLAKWLTIYFAEHQGAAKRWLKHAAERCDRDYDEAEVDRLLTWAESLFGGTPGQGICTRERLMESARPQVDLDAIYEVARNGLCVAGLEAMSLGCHSIMRDRYTAKVLAQWAAYSGCSDPWVCFGSRDQFWTRRLSRVAELLHAHEQIVPSPMKAQLGLTADGRMSEHSKEGTGERLFLVVEFDFARLSPKGKPTVWAPLIDRCEAAGLTMLDAQAAILERLTRSRPLWLVVFSGSKSLQGWFPCRGESEEELHRWFNTEARRLGADPMTWCKSQFVRMPDGTRAPNREGKSVRQSIEYYNPSVL